MAPEPVMGSALIALSADDSSVKSSVARRRMMDGGAKQIISQGEY